MRARASPSLTIIVDTWIEGGVARQRENAFDKGREQCKTTNLPDTPSST
jgi:hypothetical protein